MRTFKIVDCVVQFVLLVTGVLLVAGQLDISKTLFGALYFVLGGWQLMSIFVHLANKKGSLPQLRRINHVLLLFTIGLGIILTLMGLGFIFLLILLFWSPVLALFYFVGCFRETSAMIKQQVADEQV